MDIKLGNKTQGSVQ